MDGKLNRPPVSSAEKPAWNKPELVRLGTIADVHTPKPSNTSNDGAKPS